MPRPSADTVMVVGLMTAYLITRLTTLTRIPIFIDEAINIQFARTLSSGELVGLGKCLCFKVVAPAVAVAPDPLLVIRVAPVLSGAIALYLVIRLGATLATPSVGYVAGALYVVTPYSLFFDRLAVSDAFLPACAAAVMLFSVKAVRQRGLSAPLALGALLLLAVLVKFSAFTYVAIPVAAAATLLPLREWRWGVRRCAPLALGMVVLLGVWQYTSLIPFDAANQIGRPRPREIVSLARRNFAALFQLLPFMLTPVTLVISALAVLKTLIRPSDRVGMFLVCVLGVLVLPYMMLAQLWWSRYFVAALVPVYLLAARLLIETDAALGRRPALQWCARAAGGLALVLVLSQDIRLIRSPISAPSRPLFGASTSQTSRPGTGWSSSCNSSRTKPAGTPVESLSSGPRSGPSPYSASTST